MAPPVGLLIGNDPNNPTHRVGKLIGEGACSAVYELVSIRGESDEEFAITLTPPERNADLLHDETIMYFKANLAKLGGTYIPSLPNPRDGPPSCGVVNGYRFVVSERMEAPLSDVIPRLLASEREDPGQITEITPFGPIAVRLLKCVEALHQVGSVGVDVRPDSFMLASHGATLAKKVRMLDFSLIQYFQGIEGHRKNEGISAIAGAPLYASLHMHNGSTPSRRDDIEALGYVIAELLMKLIWAANAPGDVVQLPWANATTDEEIAKLKHQEIYSIASLFHAQLEAFNNEEALLVMQEYFWTCRRMYFDETPAYDALGKLLSKLYVVEVFDEHKPFFQRIERKIVQDHKEAAALAKSTPPTGQTTRTSPVEREKMLQVILEEDLWSDNTASAEGALNTLGVQLLGEDRIRATFQEWSGFKDVVHCMMAHSHEPDIQVKAIRVLKARGNHGAYGACSTSLMATTEAMKTFPTRGDIGLEGVQLLSLLVEGNEKNATRVVKQLGGVGIVVDAMETFATDASFVVGACHLLATLAHFKHLRTVMIDNGADAALGNVFVGHQENDYVLNAARGAMQLMMGN